MSEGISPQQRKYLSELFAPFGIKYIIVHYEHGKPKLRVRSVVTRGIECEFGDIHKFLALSREQQLRRIRKKLPC